MHDDQHRLAERHDHGKTVHGAQLYRAAADGRAHGLALFRAVRHDDAHRIGMRAVDLFRVERKIQPLRAGDLKRSGNAQVVGLHAQQAGHQAAVGAVPPIGGGEGTAQKQFGGTQRPFPAPEAARHHADPDGSGGMARRRSDHHRADNIQ